MGWAYRIKLRHLFTDSGEYDDIKKSMEEIGHAMQESMVFATFPWLNEFLKFPEKKTFDDAKDTFGEDMSVSWVDYANKMVSRMYDYCDEHRIWVD